MDLISKFVSVIIALSTLTLGIIKIVSIGKITKIEKTLLTDYKKTLTTFIESIIIIFLSSILASAVYVMIFPNTRLESFAAFFIISIFFSSLILAVVYLQVVFYRKRKTIYYVVDEENKLYIHKSISDNELILSKNKYLNNDSDSFQI